MSNANPNRFLRADKLPYIWCPGCGNAIVISALTKALNRTDWEQDKIAAVSGIGCSSRSTGYLDLNTLHTLHGRAIPFATGVKMTRPELNVMVLTGDGDATAIGGNHFIHACRRNIDLTVVLFNNNIYGMTGGQYSPTTPVGARATTAVYGNVEPSFDPCELAAGSGATFVARTTVATPKEIEEFIFQGFQNKGFSLIEVVASCHEQYGRRNNMKKPIDMINYFKSIAVKKEDAASMSAAELEGKLVTGILKNESRPEYVHTYDHAIMARAQGRSE